MISLSPGVSRDGGNKTGAAVMTFTALQDVSDLIKINKTINFQSKFYLEEGDTIKHQKHTTYHMTRAFLQEAHEKQEMWALPQQGIRTTTEKGMC